MIPSNDGKTILVGRGTVWVFRDAKTGAVLQSLPAGSVPFDWTPDYKGVVYRSQKLDASYLGIDGSTTSPYVPTLSNLADIKWLQNGTSVFSAVGTDKKLSLSMQLPGKDPAFLGIVPTVDARAGRMLVNKPPAAIPPATCKPGAVATVAATAAAQ